MELDDDFLKWEYSTSARADAIWAIAGIPLARAADALWQRAEAYRQLWNEAFALGPDGTIANTERRLSPAELETLQDQGFERVALMLLGFALENTAKAILIQKDPLLVSDDGLFKLKTHDLVRLVERCGLAPSEEQVLHLNVLRDYLEWLGRYPVPLGATGKAAPKSVPGAWVWHRLPDPRTTWTTGRELLQRMIDERDDAMFRKPLSNER